MVTANSECESTAPALPHQPAPLDPIDLTVSAAAAALRALRAEGPSAGDDVSGRARGSGGEGSRERTPFDESRKTPSQTAL